MLSKAPRRPFLSKVPSLLMSIKFRFGHEDTNVVKSSTEVILVQGTVLVDVHQLEAVLVHLDLIFGESSSFAFILSLAHLVCVSCFCR